MDLCWQAETLFRDEGGYTITHHQGDGSKSVDWHADTAQGSFMEVCLNQEGRAEVINQGVRLLLDEDKMGIYDVKAGNIRTRRNRGYDHKFTTVSLNKEYLQDELAPSQFLLQPEVRSAIYEQSIDFPLCIRRSMQERDLEWLNATQRFNNIPVAGQNLWMSSKIMEFIACHFFKQELSEQELFCQKIKRQDSDRIIQTKLFIEKNYSEPLLLEDLSKHIGCSKTHLSRVFSKETGVTIRSYLRSARIRNARKYLQSGKYNVTEAAFECGYNSLSHFTKAFQEELGYKPSKLK